MDDYDVHDYDNVSYEELIKTIQLLSALEQDEKIIWQLTSALGVYINKLQEEYEYPSVFPLELLPITKSEIKKWGYEYAWIVVNKEGQLKQYQQDAALCYTQFRKITPTQWKAIKNQEVEDLILYNAEMRDTGWSNLPLSQEYKVIIDDYRKDYNSSVAELHEYLKGRTSSSGCMGRATILLMAGLLIAWILNN